MNPLDNISDDKKEIVNLTNEQQLSVLKCWDSRPTNPPSIMELIELVFPDIEEKLKDSRSRFGRIIKEYLISKDLKQPAVPPSAPPSLKDEDKEYIINNCSTMNIMELSKEIWKNPRIGPNTLEVRLVKEFIKNEVPKESLYDKNENLETFKPPKTIDQACARINTHVEGANFDGKALTPTQRKQCTKLMDYMCNFRFAHHFNLITDDDDKKLFQNTFVKYIYDKTDLSQEDLDQYLTLANEAVMESSIKRMISMLEGEQKRTLDETGKLNMTLVEAIKTSRDEYNACRNRQDKLYKALDVERSKRMNERIGPQFTLLNIVEEMKKEETRKILVLEAEKRVDKLKGEIDRLSAFDDSILRIWGADTDMFING